jgi:hypothetical protein
MIAAFAISRQVVEVPCTVEVENTFDCLFTHVDLQGFQVGPGDEVLVHDAPADVPYGERVVVERRATVVRASWPERLWTRLTGDLEFMELLEFSFTSGRAL